MIDKILTKDLIVTGCSFKNWREAAIETASMLLDKNLITTEFIDSVIETVEQYGPYMILVPKVCFFHGEPGPHVKKPCLALSVFENEVKFEEFNKQGIKCCFVFGAVDKNSHMLLLKHLASLLQNDNFIELITNNGNKEEILKIIKNY